MKRLIFTLAMLIGICAMANAQKHFDKIKISSSRDSLSYAIGMVLCQNLAEQDISDIDPTIVGKAFRDILANKTPSFANDDAERLIEEYFAKVNAERAEKAMKAEKEFFENNAKEPGVKTTESGIQYIVVKEGNGKKPTLENSVKIHYEGKLTNGDIFDSDLDSDEPTQFNLDNLIQGMAEGIMMMSEGSEYILYIPSELGYGSYSPAEVIPPYSTLVFDVELISVEDKIVEEDNYQINLDDMDFHDIDLEH